MSATQGKPDAAAYGLAEIYIPKPQYVPQYGEIMMANEESKGGLMMINESKGKRIIGISGGSRKLFVFEEESGTRWLLLRIVECGDCPAP
jgi:hypothetical protein